MTTGEIYKIAPYVEEHYKRCWVEGYIAGLQAKDPTLDDIAEKCAEKMDISKGWFDGCEIDELIKESYKAGAEWQKEQMMKEAVEAEVYKFGEIVYVKECSNAELAKYLSQFNNGDKVKIIAIHETDIR